MKYCTHCKAKINTDRTHCPLCFREIKDLENSCDCEQTEKMFLERKQNETHIKNNSFVTKLFVFLSICAVSICGVINYLVNRNLLWSLLVLSGIVYIWILIAHTIISRRGSFEKVLFQVLGIMFVLSISELISDDKNWLQSYVFPSIVMATVFTLLMITFIRKDKGWMLSFVAITMLLGIASVLNFIYFDTFKILSYVSIPLCVLTTFGYFTFGFGVIRNEFLKKFHL